MSPWPFAILLALAGCGQTPVDEAAARADLPPEVRAESVSFRAADGVTVYGNYRATPHPKALILLFHQAGANRAEYRDIAPRLVADGYATLAIDQRSGGTMFGAANRTVAAVGESATYDEALPDLRAALAWAEAKGAPLVVVGSSYSAALATLLAADHPELAGLMLFSPGEYLADGQAVGRAAARVRVPLFVTSAREPDEVADARKVVAAAPAATKVLYVPRTAGAHGVSALTAKRDPAGAGDLWTAVERFLAQVAPGTGTPIRR